MKLNTRTRNIVGKIIIFLCVFNSISTFSQKINSDYLLFSDNKKSEYLVFKNDSIVSRKVYHAGGILVKDSAYYSVYRDYNYKIKNDSITILEFEKENYIKFKINNQYLENSLRREIYVLRSDFEEFPDFAIKYNDDIFWIDSPKTSNGLLIKSGKRNKKLSKIMKNKTADDIDVKVYINYEAFEKFGYKYIFGVIEIWDKN